MNAVLFLTVNIPRGDNSFIRKIRAKRWGGPLRSSNLAGVIFLAIGLAGCAQEAPDTTAMPKPTGESVRSWRAIDPYTIETDLTVANVEPTGGQTFVATRDLGWVIDHKKSMLAGQMFRSKYRQEGEEKLVDPIPVDSISFQDSRQGVPTIARQDFRRTILTLESSAARVDTQAAAPVEAVWQRIEAKQPIKLDLGGSWKKEDGYLIRSGQGLHEFLIGLAPDTLRGIESAGTVTLPQGAVLLRTISVTENPVAPQAVEQACNAFEKSLSQSGIEIEGPVEDALFVNASLFYLRSAFGGPKDPNSGSTGMAPFGLTNSLYFGHKFWDMDVWILPALGLFEPEAAREVAEYRLRRLEAAKKNAQLGTNMGGPLPGLRFPWESSLSGGETVPGPSRDQLHITASVLWGLTFAESLGVVDATRVANVSKEAARMYAARSKKTSRGLEFLNTMSPDENHTGDNDLYTNVLLQWLANGRTFSKQNPAYYLPKDNRSFLTYDGDEERGYKQAAAVLSIFPLQFPAAEEQAKVMIDRFAPKVIKNGPAMSDSVHATIYARLGETEKAYATWREAWEPFTKGAQMVFSEKRVRPRTYFYTGSAGALNTVLYGFAGLRLDERIQPGHAKIDLPVKRGFISYRANLPPEWKAIRLRGLHVAGKTTDVEIRAKE